jgi:hypothetical protein
MVETPALLALIERLWLKFRDAGGGCVVDFTGVLGVMINL